MFDINLEAMQAQLQSKFGKELDALWQEVIDYRDKSLEGMSYKSKYLAIKKFFLNTTSKKFIASLWKNAGLHVDMVKINNYMWGGFCTWIWFDKNGKQDQIGTVQIENMLNAGYLSRYFYGMLGNEQHFSAAQLMKIASSYDTIKGCVKESMRIEMRKIFYATIGFDLETAFLLSDQMPKNSGIDNLTAREITGVVLHEIGHTLTLVEHAADAYARMSSFKYITSAFQAVNQDNIDEIVNLAVMVADKLTAAGDTANANNLTKVAFKLKKDITEAGTAANKSLVHNSVIGFLDTVFSFIADVIIVPLNVVFGNTQGDRFSSSAQKRKTSDLPLNNRLITWQERKADEYAFGHGYGADIATALRKIYGFFDRMGMSASSIDKLNQAERLHQDLGFFEKARIISHAPALAADYGYSLYPAGVKRFRELLNLAVQQVKQHSNDPDYVVKYMQDIEEILHVIDNPSRADEYLAKVYRGYDIFMKYISLPSFIDYIVHGRVKRELEDLLNDVDKIGNNLLTYYGLKIQQLAKK